MSTLGRRLKALETVRAQRMKDVREMTDAELLKIIGPGADGGEPTDAELVAIIYPERISRSAMM